MTSGQGGTLFPESDLYGFTGLLSDAEQFHLTRLRRVLDVEARPLLSDYWDRAETPIQLRDSLARLDIVNPPDIAEHDGEPREIFVGFRNFELARTDASVAILYNGQVGMFRSLVREGGSDEQRRLWAPRIASFEMTGCFAITEPLHGSDVARGLDTSARLVDGSWILNGEKRWIGNADFSEYVVVLARDESDRQVKAFLVRTDAPGLTMDTITRKTSLRMVRNSNLYLHDVVVAEDYRLQRINSFADVSTIFSSLRPDAAWNAVGIQAGAYESALAYTRIREQFGRPIAGFQMIQEKLVRMIGNLTASLGFSVRLSQLRDQGIRRDVDAALAKTWICDRMRETVALAREVVGGNGIILDHNVARFFCDAESYYTFEGTREINTLIVGRSITGLSAFVN
jgi:glutaryl-CoA dehydrogenase